MNLKLTVLAILAVLVSLLGGCGGGGGGTTPPVDVTLTGVVQWLASGAAPSPAATVQAGSRTALTNATDGSFSINVPSGTTSISVVYQAAGASPVTFRFDFAAVTANTDVGNLVIAPLKVSVQGSLLNSATDAPVAGATVSFGGRSATSDAAGNFSITDVAYDEAAIGQFLALVGRASASGFLTRTFSATSGATGGVVTLDTILLPPVSADDPPPDPFNVEGFVSPSAFAGGTVVKLLQNGTAIRQVTVGSDRRFSFFVEPGDYVLTFNNPTNGKSAPDAAFTLNSVNQIVRRDATLN